METITSCLAFSFSISALSILAAISWRVVPATGTQMVGSIVLAAYPVEGQLLEQFVGGVTEERLSDLFPIAVLLVDHLGNRPDGFIANFIIRRSTLTCGTVHLIQRRWM
jgi:hypothetical protein